MTANDIRRRPLRAALALFAGFAVSVMLSTVTGLVLHGTHVFPAEGEPMATPLVTSLPLAWIGARLHHRPAALPPAG
jgi:hypothetical protein